MLYLFSRLEFSLVPWVTFWYFFSPGPTLLLSDNFIRYQPSSCICPRSNSFSQEFMKRQVGTIMWRAPAGEGARRREYGPDRLPSRSLCLLQCSLYCVAFKVISAIIPRNWWGHFIEDIKTNPLPGKSGEHSVTTAVETMLV